MVIENKELMLYYASMATLGSVVGCLLLYGIGSRGGQPLLRKRFGGPRLERAMELSRKYGVLAVAIPAILPPPAPFKVVVLLAGVSRVPLLQFVLAVAFGRGIRYFGESWLAVRYGDTAIEMLAQNGRTVSVMLAVVILLIGATYFFWKRFWRGDANH